MYLLCELWTELLLLWSNRMTEMNELFFSTMINDDQIVTKQQCQPSSQQQTSILLKNTCVCHINAFDSNVTKTIYVYSIHMRHVYITKLCRQNWFWDRYKPYVRLLNMFIDETILTFAFLLETTVNNNKNEFYIQFFPSTLSYAVCSCLRKKKKWFRNLLHIFTCIECSAVMFIQLKRSQWTKEVWDE